MRALLIIPAFLFIGNTFSQTINNGNFNSGTDDWNCNPEINQESVYGGSGSNNVAEVDAAAGLCQTLSGFTPGAVYRVRFLASRRTSCGPTVQSLTVTVSGGALNTTISRNGSGFSLDQESFNFTATATSHTITFSVPPSITETCNILVDNIRVQLVSGLPVELLDFTAAPVKKTVELNWQTESELRNDHFTLERSSDGQKWKQLATVKGAGTTTTQKNYTFIDSEPFGGISYYRLSQTDTDGKYEELKIVSVSMLNRNSLIAYPNPADDQLTISGADEEELVVTDAFGRQVEIPVRTGDAGAVVLDVSSLPSGTYFVKAGIAWCRFIRN